LSSPLPSFTNLLVTTRPSNSQTQRPLLFVIRDHLGTTPLSNLQATLSQDLRRIQDLLAEPDGLADAGVQDYFDLAFEALPHKVSYPGVYDLLPTKNLPLPVDPHRRRVLG
jgi:Root hair defective 3 GTP-binding protein (RHD3)